MKRIVTLVLTLFVAAALTGLGGLPVSAQQAKTLVVQPKTGDFAGQTFYANSHALLIGIDPYQNLPKDKWLQFADKDASDLRDLLVKSYGFLPENVTVLLNEQATKANIVDALSALADKDRVKPDDRVFIFFSGHGQTVNLADGTPRGFLIPFDAKVDMDRLDNPAPYLRSCIPMDSLWSFIEEIPARHRLLVADACFGGLLVRSKTLGGERPNRALISGLLTKPAMLVMTAGDSGQEAKEDPKLGHSAFTFKFLEELRSEAATPDQVFLASELANSVKIGVGNLPGIGQTPQFGAYGGTQGDFVFLTTAPRNVPPLPARDAELPPVNPEKPVIVPPNNPEKPNIQGDPSITRTNPKDGAEMVLIPAGPFLMGDDDMSNNKRRTVNLEAFYMYKTPVTVAQYQKYCTATGAAMPPAPSFDPDWKNTDHPIVDVSWSDAMKYADWAGVSLPKETEWEKAARGPDGKKYPWGDDWHPAKCANGLSGTVAVGRYTESPYGLSDMAGNVWQWCADDYDGTGSFRVLRGGCWGSTEPRSFRAAYRLRDGPGGRDGLGGFRCGARADSR